MWVLLQANSREAGRIETVSLIDKSKKTGSRRVLALPAGDGQQATRHTTARREPSPACVADQ